MTRDEEENLDALGRWVNRRTPAELAFLSLVCFTVAGFTPVLAHSLQWPVVDHTLVLYLWSGWWLAMSFAFFLKTLRPSRQEQDPDPFNGDSP